MNTTSLTNMANNDLKYIAGELNFVNDILNTTQDTNSVFVTSISETLKAYKLLHLLSLQIVFEVYNLNLH